MSFTQEQINSLQEKLPSDFKVTNRSDVLGDQEVFISSDSDAMPSQGTFRVDISEDSDDKKVRVGLWFDWPEDETFDNSFDSFEEAASWLAELLKEDIEVLYLRYAGLCCFTNFAIAYVTDDDGGGNEYVELPVMDGEDVHVYPEEIDRLIELLQKAKSNFGKSRYLQKD